MEEFGLYDLLAILKKRLKIIILFPVILVLVFGIISFYVLDSSFESSSTVMVGESKLAHTYVSLIEGRDLYEEVIEKLNLDIGYSDFKESLDVSLIRDPEIIKINVVSSDPELASNIANGTVDIFMEKAKDFMEKKIQIVDGKRIEEEPTAPRIINRAYPTRKPISPKPALNMIIAGVLGTILGVFTALLIEFIDGTIKSSRDIEKHLEIPILGSIPALKGNEEKFISYDDFQSPNIEVYRGINTNIEYSNNKELRSIIITSTLSNERADIISINLANSLAQENKRVLLIDADFRKPKIGDILGKKNNKGLANILEKNVRVEDAIYEYEDSKNLHILTSGNVDANPIAILNSNKLSNFIKEMENNYDMVIIYAPPIGVVTDGVKLSALVDGVVLVTTLNYPNIEEVIKGKELINKVNDNIIGIIVNNVLDKDKVYKNRYNEYYN